MKKNIFYLSLLAGLIVLDQISKYLAEHYLSQNILTIIPNTFTLQLAHNEGIAFSLPLPPFIIITLTLVVCIYLIYEIFKPSEAQTPKKLSLFFTQNLTQISSILILGGAVGNLIDRLWHGYVIDMFSLQYFAIFNLADTWITLGVTLLLLSELKNAKNPQIKI